jgi:beta-lactamase regulating signal transducer with metallopeptidase domain
MASILIRTTDYLLTQGWQIAVLAALVATISLVLRNRSAHVRYLLWLIVLAKCLVPPLLTVPLAILPQDRTPAPVVSVDAETCVVKATVTSSGAAAPLVPPPPMAKLTVMERLERITARQWLGIGWAAGVVAFFTTALTKALRASLWLRRWRRPAPAGLDAQIRDLLAGLGLKTAPKFWLIKGVGQPFVWGLLRGNVYLPADFATADSDFDGHRGRRGILVHELCHTLRFDAAVNLLQVVAQAVFWFHPVVWWANKRIRAEREKCCDEMAIARLGASPKDYSSAIIDTLASEYETTRLDPSLAVAGPVNTIEERIKTIMKPGKRFQRRPSTPAVVAISLMAALALPTTLAVTQQNPRPQALPAESPNLRVLEASFDPIQQGKNVLYVKVQNRSDAEQTFAVHIQTRSPDYGRGGVGWGRPFFDEIPAGETKSVRCAFHIQGPITNSTWVRLQFYNPLSADKCDFDKHFGKTKYFASDLKKRGTTSLPLEPAAPKESRAAIDTLRQVQFHIRAKKYEEAWRMFTRDYRDADQIDTLAKFIRVMEPRWGYNLFHWERDDFLALQPQSVSARDESLTLTATCRGQKWTIDLVREAGQLKIDWISGYEPRILQWQNWEQRLLPKTVKRSTKHFDIYYFRDSTAEDHIARIAAQKEESYRNICQFLDKDFDIRIRAILFEDKQSKHRATGHHGAGWAYGNTIVEVYNEQEQVDPYHETTHILMGRLGSPPALLNEGFAVYMQVGHVWKNEHINVTSAGLAKQGKLTPLSELITRTEIGSRSDDGEVAYPQSASFVKFLIDEYGKDRFLRAYNELKASNDTAIHQQNAEKLMQIYGKSLPQLEQQWRTMLLSSKPGPAVLRAAEPGVTSQDKDEIQVEVRLLYVPADANDVDDFLKEEKLQLAQMKQDPEQWSCLLNDEQVKRLLALARQNPGWTCLVAPRATVRAGHAATVSMEKDVKFISGYTEGKRPFTKPKPKHDSVKTGVSLQVTPRLQPGSTNIIATHFTCEISEITGYEKSKYKGKYPCEIPTVRRSAVQTGYSAYSGQTWLQGVPKITRWQDDRAEQRNLLILIKAEKSRVE